MDKLIEMLEKSVEKNGTVPLTNLHMLNICRLARKELGTEKKVEEGSREKLDETLNNLQDPNQLAQSLES